MSSDRLVYVPRSNRKRQRRQQERFHGAFAGGFSAGYQEEEEESWQQPRATTTTTRGAAAIAAGGDDSEEQISSISREKRQQRPEDYMDEQDHQEWGGPTSINKDFRDANDSKKPATAPDAAATMPLAFELFDEPTPQNMGRRLLRILGWREGGSAAYIPEEHAVPKEETPADEEHKVLSKKRLRKIELQQKRVKIPQPKLDACGLGYEPYHNAPEFKAHKERRRKLAKAKAQPGQNVYRVSDALGMERDDDADEQYRQHRRKGGEDDDEDGPYVSYEAAEDFAGSDADEAYDDDKDKDKDEYHNVAYEHNESDDDNEPHKAVGATSTKASFGGVLSSWAESSAGGGLDSLGENTSPAVVTSDGRPVLPGFVLGGGNPPHQSQRFRGPDIPPNYRVKHHEFRPEEHPRILKALSHAVQLEADDLRKRASVEDALKSNLMANAPSRQTQTIRPAEEPEAPGHFTGLSTSMKNRFTSSTENSNIESEQKDPESAHNKQYRLIRSTLSFAPEPLLCKRFHVPVPKNIRKNTSTDAVGSGAGMDDINAMAKAARAKKSETVGFAKLDSKKPAAAIPKILAEIDEGDVVMSKETAHSSRPSMQIYKSIFDPSSTGDSSGSEDDEESSEKNPANAGGTSTSAVEPTNGKSISETKDDDNNQLVLYDDKQRRDASTSEDEGDDSNLSDDDEEGSGRDRRRRKRRKKEKRSRSKHTTRREKESKKKKKKKKRKKKKRSRREEDSE